MGKNTKEYLLAILLGILLFISFIVFGFISSSLPEQIQRLIILAQIIMIIIAAFIKGLMWAIEEDKKESEEK